MDLKWLRSLDLSCAFGTNNLEQDSRKNGCVGAKFAPTHPFFSNNPVAVALAGAVEMHKLFNSHS
ncbi:MAG: hypothetical protein GY792_10280 [Gammaproteobacteria bacterium]|nr:hypothetical protein [Gammaproteobacteria bacterium]